MIKTTPERMALKIAERSAHLVFKMGAVICDARGRIVSWGWNTQNHGYGVLRSGHAEAHALRRANRRRIDGSTMVIAGFASSNHKSLLAMPCSTCETLLRKFGVKAIRYTTKTGEFMENAIAP